MRDVSARGVYDGAGIETLLRMALDRTWPWDAPTFRYEWIRAAAEKAARSPHLHVDVRVPWWRRYQHEGRLSVMVDPLPTLGDPVPAYIFCAASLSPATLVANLALALSVVGSNPDELVTMYETKQRTPSGGYLHAIGCIPSSRVA